MSINKEKTMNYITVISRKRNSVKLLDSKGCITEVSKEEFAKMSQVPLFGEHYIKGRPVKHSSGNKPFVNPVNPLDRAFLYIQRKQNNCTDVVTINNTIISIPDEYIHTWHGLDTIHKDGSDALYENAWMYPYGRSLSDLTFGIEFEFTAPKNRLKRFLDEMVRLVGRKRFFSRFEDVQSNDINEDETTQWVLKRDGSIEHPDGYGSYELTTQIMHSDDIDSGELKKVLDCIKNVFSGEVNSSCGTHIHIGNFAPIDETIYGGSIDDYQNYIHDKLKQYIICYSRYEKSVFDKLVSYSRRRDRNEYCRSCIDRCCESERYFKINLRSLISHRTIENRHHHGTLDYEEIRAWTIFNGLFLLACLKNVEPFNDVNDMMSLFNRIGLPKDIQLYYVKLVSEIIIKDIRDIENALSFRPQKEELPDLVRLGSVSSLSLCA